MTQNVICDGYGFAKNTKPTEIALKLFLLMILVHLMSVLNLVENNRKSMKDLMFGGRFCEKAALSGIIFLCLSIPHFSEHTSNL